MRTRRVVVSLTSAIMLGILHAGCGRPPDRSAQGTESTPAPSAPPAITGAFEAISTTAMGITGDLTLTDRAVTFSRGLAYSTESSGSSPASADYASGAGTWAALLAVAPDTIIELRRVTGETVGADPANMGLCGRNAVTFIALAQGGQSPASPDLKVAAFQGSAMPGAQGNATSLCGTFTYGRRR